MNNTYLNIIADYGPLMGFVVCVIGWGSRVNSRLSVLEQRAGSLEENFKSIESKIDRVSARIDDRCDMILNAIMSVKAQKE